MIDIILSTLVAVLIGLFTFVWLYKQLTNPSKVVEGSKTTEIYYDAPPGPLQFYIRLIFSWNNVNKPGFLIKDKKIPRFEIYCKNASSSVNKVQQWARSCGFDKNIKEVPLTYPFCNVLPMMGYGVAHPKWPMKSLSSLVHIRQTIELLRPLSFEERLAKKGILEGGESTDRGTEFCGATEIYTSNAFEQKDLIGKGASYFLIVKRRKSNTTQPKTEEPTKELPPVTKTTTFKVPENTGRRYAATSGDYNPWHLYPFLAQLFGFKKAIAQGYWSVSKCLAEIGDKTPKYPLKLDVEWKRPLFMPSTVTFTERATENKVYFELCSEDKQHIHLVGVIETYNPS